jgi:ankyrin repeat protein
MRPSEQRKQSHWIWQEYARSGSLAYLEESVRDDSSFLRPESTSGSLLERAIHDWDVEAMQRLVSLGADVNAPADGGYTYLHTAIECKANQAKIVDILLNAGANPSVAGICGRTALHHAAMFGLADVIPSMISHGADINARTTVDNQTTPLMEAAWFGHVDSVRCLLSLGADQTLLDAADMGGSGGGRSARDFAVENSHPAVILELDRWAESHSEG